MRNVKSCRILFVYPTARFPCLLQVQGFAQGVIQKISAKYSSEANAVLQSECEGSYCHASLQRVQKFKVPLQGTLSPRSACGSAELWVSLDAEQSSCGGRGGLGVQDQPCCSWRPCLDTEEESQNH